MKIPRAIFHSGGVIRGTTPPKMGEVPIELYPYQRDFLSRIKKPVHNTNLGLLYRPERKPTSVTLAVTDFLYSRYREPVGAFVEMMENIDRQEETPATRFKRARARMQRILAEEMDRELERRMSVILQQQKGEAE